MVSGPLVHGVHAVQVGGEAPPEAVDVGGAEGHQVLLSRQPPEELPCERQDESEQTSGGKQTFAYKQQLDQILFRKNQMFVVDLLSPQTKGQQQTGSDEDEGEVAPAESKDEEFIWLLFSLSCLQKQTGFATAKVRKQEVPPQCFLYVQRGRKC